MTRITELVKAECDTCGDPYEVRPSRKSFAARHKVNGDYCNGRPVTAEAKPAPGNRPKAEDAPNETGDCRACQRKGIGMRAGKLSIHKDFKTNARCVGSLHAPKDVKADAPKPKAQPKPKAEKVKRPQVAVTAEAKAMAKAVRFAQDIKQFGWRTEFETNPTDTHPMTGESIASVTAVAKRGSRDNVETMRITWWGAACIGGDDRITWEHKSRKIAVRNAKACRDRASRPHEELTQESFRIQTRKAAPSGSKGKGGLRPLPFDPATVTDEELLERLVGRTLVWTNAISEKQETATVKPESKVSIKTLKRPEGERSISVFTTEGKTRAFHLSRLVSIG